MKLKRTRITLDITWDEKREDHPTWWDWGTILEMMQKVDVDEERGVVICGH